MILMYLSVFNFLLDSQHQDFNIHQSNQLKISTTLNKIEFKKTLCVAQTIPPHSDQIRSIRSIKIN